MNLMRSIQLASGITVAVKDLDQTGTEFIAEHHLAGNAVLTRCTHVPKNATRPREYWTIETCFRGEDPRPVFRGDACEWTDYTDWLSLDAALAGLAVLGALWVADHPMLAYQQAYQDLAR